MPLSVAMWRSGLRISTSAVAWMSPAVTSAGPRTSRRSVTGSSAVDGEHEVLEVQDDVGDVLGDAGDGVELVERVVEADLR